MNKNKIKILQKNDTVQFFVLLILTALVLYFVPVIKPLFFLVTLYFFFKSKRDYFWLAYYFMIILDVGGFFESLTDDIIKIGPAYLSLLFLFSIISFFKVGYKYGKERTPFFIKNNVNLWIIYLCFLMFLGLFIIGNRGGGKSGLRYFFETLMMLPSLTLLYSVRKFIPDEKALANFSRLIFASIIVNVIGQFIHLLFNDPMYYMFIEKVEVEHGPDYVEKDFTQKLIRPVWGTMNSLFAIFLALYWSIRKKSAFKQHYLMFFLALSIFSIFITATRGWIIAILVFIVASLFVIKLENKLRLIKLVLLVLASFTLLYFINDSVQIQTNQVVGRLSSLNDLASGDLTAGGTNSRLTDRSEPVMELFYKRPLFGNGFSQEGLEANDEHVGNQNALMSGGVLGYFIIFLLWGQIVKATLKANRFYLPLKHYNGEVILIIPFLFSLFIIHSTSMSIFGYIAYLKHPSKLLFLGVIFALMNQIIFNYKKNNSIAER